MLTGASQPAMAQGLSSSEVFGHKFMQLLDAWSWSDYFLDLTPCLLAPFPEHIPCLLQAVSVSHILVMSAQHRTNACPRRAFTFENGVLGS